MDRSKHKCWSVVLQKMMPDNILTTGEIDKLCQETTRQLYNQQFNTDRDFIRELKKDNIIEKVAWGKYRIKPSEIKRARNIIDRIVVPSIESRKQEEDVVESEGYIECLECGTRLKRINNTHLFKCSQMTMQEYSIKHNIPLDKLVLQSVVDRAAHTRSNRTDEQNELTRIKREHNNRVANSIEFDKDEYQIILGSMLGDAYIYRGKKHLGSTYLILEQGIKQLDFLLWKGTKLRNCEPKYFQYYGFNSVVQRMRTQNIVKTKNSPTFGDLGKNFYTKEENKNIVNYDIVKHLDPLGLAVWYMDDGCYSVAGQTCEISTQNFNEESIDILIRVLKENFDLHPRKFDSKQGWTLRFFKEEREKFFRVIDPHVIPSMRYKLNDSTSPVITIAKQVSFDSAHYLTDHPAKCENLHGGRYYLTVFIKNHINVDTGMVMDYTYLKHVIKTHILDKFDHHFINGLVPELNWRSTTENMSVWIWFTLLECLPGLFKIRLYETPDSFCDYEGPSLEDLKKDNNHPDLQYLKDLQCRYSKEFRSKIGGKIEEIFSEPLFDPDPYIGSSMELKTGDF